MRSLMFRRWTPSLPLAATSVQVRAVAFAGQSTDLQSITNERGYDSPMWIAVEDDKWWYGRLTAPKANAKPIKVMVAKRLELFNEDQLKSPLGQTPAESHSSLLTQKPYKGPMLKELEQRALIHDYQSKWWLTPNAVRQRNLYLKPRARPHAILIRVPTEVLHVSDFQNPDALLQHPLAGDTGRPLMNDIGATLTAAMNERPSKLKAPVWFTSTSLTDMQLDPAPGAQTVTSVSSEVATYYNLESFEKADQLLATAPADYQPDPSNPRYLTTGSTITSKHIAEALSKSGHAHSLWMTSKDLEFKQRGATGDLFKLKPNAPSVSLPAFTATWFFVDDMANPAAALKAFGTHTR